MKLILMAIPKEERGLIGYKPTVLFTGVGKLNAAITTLKVINTFRPSMVINLGTAGSITYPPGTLVECTRFEEWDAHPLALSRPIRTLPFFPNLNLEVALCRTGDSFKEAQEPNCVYDMEAYAIAKACKSMATRFICIKYVTDAGSFEDWEKGLEKASIALSEFYFKAFEKVRHDTATDCICGEINARNCPVHGA